MEELKITNQDKPVVRKISSEFSILPIIIGVVLLVLGVATGYFLYRQSGSVVPGSEKKAVQEAVGEIKKSQVYGASDEKAFRDQAEGTLEKGGVDGEGSHKLIRTGGESQTAYLTSSTLNLDLFVGKKVKIWGETYKAQKAGWFMDVGRVEVLE